MKAHVPKRPLEDEARRTSTLPTSVGSATERSLWADNPDAGGLRSDIAARAFMSGVLRRGMDAVSLSGIKRITAPCRTSQESLSLSPATHLSSHQRRAIRSRADRARTR